MAKYRITKVTLIRSAGFPAGGPSVVDLGAGLNVVWGPNGIGKSSLARAMRALIWGKGSEDIEANAELELPDSLWDLRLNNGELQQIRQADNSLMNLPGRTDELSDSYWFPLHELLDSGQKGEAFLNKIQTEMQGGVDLPKALSAAGGKKQFVNANHADVKRVIAAGRELKEAKQIQDKHKGVPDRIKELEADIEKLESLQTRRRLLDKAKQIKAAELEIARFENELADFPESIGSVRPDSPDRLTELRGDLAKRKKELEDERAHLNALQHELEHCGITEKRFCDETRAEKLRTLIADFEKKRELIQKHKEAFVSAEAAESEWSKQHAWIAPQPPDCLKLEECVAKLSRLAGECEPLRCAVESNSRVLKALGEVEPENIEEFSLLVVRLQDWIKAKLALESRPAGRVVSRWTRFKVVLVAFLAALIPAALAVFINPAFLFGLLAVPAVLWLLIPGAGTTTDELETALGNARSEAEKLIEKLGQPKSEWDIESCIGLLRKILEEEQKQNAALRANTSRRDAMDRLNESIEALRKWENEWEAAVKDIGLDSDIPLLRSAPFYNFSAQLAAWTKLAGDKAEKKASLELAQKEYDTVLDALRNVVGAAYDEPDNLLTMANSLMRKISRARELFGKIEEQESVIERTQSRYDECEAGVTAFWEKCGIERDDDNTLKSVAGQVNRWEETKLSLVHERTKLDRLLEESETAKELAGNGSFEKLEAECGEIDAKLGELDTLREELWTLKKEYSTLLDGDQMAKAALQHELALESLDKLRRNEVLAVAVNQLSGHIEKEMETRCRPEALERASKWLERITQGKHTLGAGSDGFFARDTVQGRNQALDELSSATRVQLLFSVRMAFIETQESSSGVQFPIFLDELLANSDDIRAAAIVGAINEIAKVRQVFYFTAQRDELEKIRHFSGENFNEVSLVGDEALFTGTPGKYVYGEAVVPEPVEDYGQYGELCGVPRADLWRNIESLHAWHLFTNSELLHAALIQGLGTIGQVLTAMKDNENIRRLGRLLNIARRYAKAGRCHKLYSGDNALNDPGLQIDRSSGYWADTLEYIKQRQSVTGNELLEAIENKEIKRYHDDTKKRLRDWLMDHEYLAEGERRSVEDILARLRKEEQDFMPDSDEYKVVERWLNEVL